MSIRSQPVLYRTSKVMVSYSFLSTISNIRLIFTQVIKETGTIKYPVVFKDLLEVVDWANVKVKKDSKVLSPGEFGYNPVSSKWPGVSILYVNAEPKGERGNPCELPH